MKYLMPITLGTGILIAGISLHAAAENLPPGQVDFGSFAPSASGGEFVEVNVTSSLISLAARFIDKDQPDIAKLLKGLQLVHVNVIGVTDENRGELENKAKEIRKQLDGNGWERVVLAQQQDQNVGVYLKTQNKEVVQGLVVTVMDGNKQAVFVNVVG
ncbi:MAG: DUF4252 domain-containing protein, partial [Limisphaerales bacterium]